MIETKGYDSEEINEQGERMRERERNTERQREREGEREKEKERKRERERERKRERERENNLTLQFYFDAMVVSAPLLCDRHITCGRASKRLVQHDPLCFSLCVLWCYCTLPILHHLRVTLQ